MRSMLAALAALAATPALAHEGHHEQMMLAEQARHLASQPDHLAAFASLAALALAGGWAWRRTVLRRPAR